MTEKVPSFNKVNIVCVCVCGGGILSERVYVHFSRYYVHLAKFMGEIMSTRTKMSRGI